MWEWAKLTVGWGRGCGRACDMRLGMCGLMIDAVSRPCPLWHKALPAVVPPPPANPHPRSTSQVGFTREEAVTFWACKGIYAGWFLIAPLCFGIHGVVATLCMQLLAEMVMGWVLAFMF